MNAEAANMNQYTLSEINKHTERVSVSVRCLNYNNRLYKLLSDDT